MIIDGIAMKGTRMIVHASLQKVVKQLHISHMGIKTGLLACGPIYWVKTNADIEDRITHCTTCLDFKATQPKDKTTSPEIPGR